MRNPHLPIEMAVQIHGELHEFRVGQIAAPPTGVPFGG
jgi:hypothetical protein